MLSAKFNRLLEALSIEPDVEVRGIFNVFSKAAFIVVSGDRPIGLFTGALSFWTGFSTTIFAGDQMAGFTLRYSVLFVLERFDSLLSSLCLVAVGDTEAVALLMAAA